MMRPNFAQQESGTHTGRRARRNSDRLTFSDRLAAFLYWAFVAVVSLMVILLLGAFLNALIFPVTGKALATSREAVATPSPLSSALCGLPALGAREGQMNSGRCRFVEVLGHHASAPRGGRAGCDFANFSTKKKDATRVANHARHAIACKRSGMVVTPEIQPRELCRA